MEVVGYVYGSDYWCADCLKEAEIDFSWDEVGTIFSNFESDYPQHCHACHIFLGGNLTVDGVKALKQAYRDGHYRNASSGPDDQFEEYMHAFSYLDWYFIWTFVGLMDPYGNVES